MKAICSWMRLSLLCNTFLSRVRMDATFHDITRSASSWHGLLRISEL